MFEVEAARESGVNESKSVNSGEESIVAVCRVKSVEDDLVIGELYYGD
jgi:hypothetical protein